MKKHYIHLLLGLGLIIIVIGCKDKAQDDNSKRIDQPITVKVAQTSSVNKSNAFVLSGTIQGANAVKLSTRIMGYVEHIYINVGDKVRKGQVLLSINNSDLMAKSAQVKAGITEVTVAYENTKKDYERYQNLYNQSSASQKELDDMTAHYNMAKARLQSARALKKEVDAQFTYTQLKAPFDGVIASKLVDVGTLAHPGMPMLLLESNKGFEVVAKVPEHSITQIKKGTKVTLHVTAIEADFEGTVSEVNTSSTLSGGQYLTTITLDNPNPNLRSGMFTKVVFPTSETQGSCPGTSIVIPKTALVHRGQLNGIYTVSQQNTAVLRWLRLGDEFGEHVEVLSGLKPEEAYIISAQEKLYNGAPINIQ